MTNLTKPVTRRTRMPRGPVSVTLTPDGRIGFRQHRHRKTHWLPLSRVFVWAVEATIADEKRAKREARAARRRDA